MKKLLIFIIICVLCATTAASAGTQRKTVIQAHRGAASVAPENTLAAFRAAREIGAEGIETDIRMTRDHRLVLRHDDAIDSTSDGHGSISEMTLAELKACDFGSWYGGEYAGEAILTLEEFLDAARELDFRVINLEMKPQSAEKDLYVRLVADTILNSGLADRVMVSSFDASLLKALKAYAPDLAVALLTIPNLSAISAIRFADYVPADKPLSEYTLQDVQRIPKLIPTLLRSYGVRGDTLEEVMLDVVREIAAMAPEGMVWSEAEQLIRAQTDLIRYVDSLDFPIDYLNCHYSTLTDRLIKAMRARGIGVNVWTPDDEKTLEKALSLRPDGIVTNAPELALRLRDQ